MWVMYLYYQSLSILFFRLILVSNVFAIDWNSDIVSSAFEKEEEKKDALSLFFGQQINDTKLFRTRQIMRQHIGPIIDVPLTE